MERLKVIHLITTIDRGGAELAILELARVQVENGYDITAIPLKGSLELLNEFHSAGVEVDTSIVSFSFLKQLRYLRTNYLDGWVLHAHLPRAEMLARLSLRSRNFYLTRHNQEQFFPSGTKTISRLLSRFVTKRAKGVVSISKAVESFLLSSREISPKHPHQVIYYGYKPHLDKRVMQENVLSSKKRLLRICTIGRLTSQKNFSFLLDFASLLQKRNIDFRIQIVGDGPDREKLTRQVLRENLSNQVGFLGRLKDVNTFLKSQDLFLFTSRYEGFGLVLLEAMDVGLPIIAPRISAIPEVVGENHPGLYKSEDLESLFMVLQEFLNSDSAVSNALKTQEYQIKQFDMTSYFEKHNVLYRL